MADPLTLAVASAVVGKTTEAMTDQARQAVAAIAARLRAKFGGRPADLAVVDAAARGGPRPEALAQLLEGEFAADPEFRDEIKTLWVQAAPAATDDAVSNVFNGQAEKVIQMRDVHGDIHL